MKHLGKCCAHLGEHCCVHRDAEFVVILLWGDSREVCLLASLEKVDFNCYALGPRMAVRSWGIRAGTSVMLSLEDSWGWAARKLFSVTFPWKLNGDS